MKEALLEHVAIMDKHVYEHMQDYSQFTIDFVENLRSDLEESVENEEEGHINESPERTFVDAMSYNVENIIAICKDGADKTLFVQFNTFLEGLTK